MNPSDVLDSRYRFERLLGTGGMSEVWLAEDLRLERMVAIKLLRDSVARTEGDLVASLQREARVIARLQHPNIVAVHDVGDIGAHHYLVMEYVQGASLRQMLEERGRIPVDEAVAYGAQVASALEYAHRQAVIHCDVKPENILVTAGGVAKVADFGVADTVTRTLDPAAAREVLGTIAYLAPEVLQGAAADPRSDVYSLALTVYEAVAGRLPFAGTTAAAIAGQRLASAAPPLRTFAHDAPPGLERVLARALAISQDDRYPTAGEFRRALLSVREGSAVAAPVPPPVAATPGAATAPPRRHQTTIVRRAPPPPPPDGLPPAMVGGIIALILLALGAATIAAIVLFAGNDGEGGPATPTPTETATAETPSPSPETPTETPTPSPTDEPTATETPTQATPSPAASPTATPTPPPTETPEATETPDDE